MNIEPTRRLDVGLGLCSFVGVIAPLDIHGYGIAVHITFAFYIFMHGTVCFYHTPEHEIDCKLNSIAMPINPYCADPIALCRKGVYQGC